MDTISIDTRWNDLYKMAGIAAIVSEVGSCWRVEQFPVALPPA